MGEHHLNPMAQAKRAAGRPPPSLDVGEGYGVFGLALEAARDSEGNVCAVLSLVGGKSSDLTLTTEVVKLPLGEIAKVPVEKVRELIAAALEQKDAVEQ